MSEFEESDRSTLDLLERAHSDPDVAAIFQSARIVNLASHQEGLTTTYISKAVKELDDLWKAGGYFDRPMRQHGLLVPLTYNVREVSSANALSVFPKAFQDQVWGEVTGISKGFIVVEDGESSPLIMHLILDKDAQFYVSYVDDMRKGTTEFPGFMSLAQAQAFVEAYDPKTEKLLSHWSQSSLTEDAITTLRSVDLSRYCDGRVGEEYLVAVKTLLGNIPKLTSGNRFQGVIEGSIYVDDLSQMRGGDVYFTSNNIQVNYVGAIPHTLIDNNGKQVHYCEVFLGINAKNSDGSRRGAIVPISSIKEFSVVSGT